MSRQWEELRESFDAVDAAGTRYQLQVYQTIHDASTQSDPNGTVEGLKRICTSDGYNCNRIDDDTFEIVASGTRVTRV